MQDNFIKKQKKKEFITVLLVCMVCLSAIIMGTSALSKKGNKEEKETEKIVDLNENDKLAEDSSEDKINVNNQVNKQSDQINEKQTKKTPETRKETTTAKNIQSTQQETESKPVSSPVAGLKFAKNDSIQWPVSGNVILDFNMDNTIYFPTLNSYKCNPAIVIQSDNGVSVNAGVKGYIEKVGIDSEIGNYVVMNIGSGYELTYGQLKDVCVQQGEMVQSDSVIGYINDPTKYYVKEGYNLYLKMTENGVPINPLDYLD